MELHRVIPGTGCRCRRRPNGCVWAMVLAGSRTKNLPPHYRDVIFIEDGHRCIVPSRSLEKVNWPSRKLEEKAALALEKANFHALAGE